MADASMNSGSGVFLHSSGRAVELSQSELLNIANDCPVDRDIYLEVEAEMLGDEVDAQAFHRIYKHMIVAMTHGRWGRANPGVFERYSEDRLERLSISTALRIRAANALSLEPWMGPILMDIMVKDDGLLRLGDFLSGSRLVMSPSGRPGFDQGLARRELLG